MTENELNTIIANGEGVRIEFKKAEKEVPKSLYETICAFMNKEGGIIFLGVDDDGKIEGVDCFNRDKMISDIGVTLNNVSSFAPATTVDPIKINYENKCIIVLKIAVSSQVHKFKGCVYDRVGDGDIRITDERRIEEIYFKKRQIFTENQIYKNITLEDLDENLFKKARTIIRNINPSHSWLEMESNMDLLRSATLYRKDFQTGENGFTLAAALIFGKDETIQSILPAYKVEAMLRIENQDRWDDRIYPPLRTNLIDTYLLLMEFVRKHLPDRFYVDEKGQRVNLREMIFREVVGNLIVHREYTNRQETALIIYKNKVIATNPNRAVFTGPLDIRNFSPYAKNPSIRKFFTAFGWTDEIGSGIRNVVKYLSHYNPGGIPLFIEDDLFKAEIPLEQLMLSSFNKQLLDFLQLPLSPYLSLDQLGKIPISSDLDGANLDIILFNLVSRWHENGIRINSLEWSIPKDFNTLEWKKVPGWSEKGIRMINKKSLYLLQILFLCIDPIPMEDLLGQLNYSNRASFRERYLLPLISEKLLERTIPDKPSSKLQRYIITHKGILFLGGIELI
ncbi:MAG: RNA-binding domain-containing protein [Ginsengibacter sp.]